MSLQLDVKLLAKPFADQMESNLSKAFDALESIKNGSCVGKEWTGWYDYPKKEGFKNLKQIEQFVAHLDLHFDHVIVVGIGGSYLGTRAIHQALSHAYAGVFDSVVSPLNKGPLLSFAGNSLSEADLIHLLDLMETRSPLLVVISKSGTTLEPAIAFRVLRQYMERKYGQDEAAERTIVVTDPSSGALRRMSQELGYKAFDIPQNVGGRFSVFTPVGLVPLALAGHKIQEFLEGADECFASLKDKTKDHPALVYAACRLTAYEQNKSIEILSYAEPRFFHLVEWYKQLFGESEGKEGKGLFPAGLCLSTDLHSLGQWVQQGPRNILETFLMFDDSGAQSSSGVERRLRIPRMAENFDGLHYLEQRYVNEINIDACRGTRLAHFDGDVPALQLKSSRLSLRSLGELMAFFCVSCGVSAAMLGVNPYDQPGVEFYKQNLSALTGKPGHEELGAEIRKRLSGI